jgi:hypothetical protein
VEEQATRAARHGRRESASAARLAAVWAERDAEIEIRLGEGPAMTYRFKCRHCGSRFSLEQQLEAHEAECGKAVGGDGEKKPTKDVAGARPCKYCGEPFANFGEYGAHRWAAHREEVLAEQARKREERKADEKKMDAAVRGKSHGPGPASPPQANTARSQAVRAIGNGQVCPTCGGVLPATTAQLVHELTAAGIPEAQAFEAVRIARRVLGASAA